jgi:ATP-dependent helicase/nuclease subunit A
VADKTFYIYRSSAGSGKTRTLAKEYLKLALGHKAHYFRHILAVTFTNKSTQEMKDRILSYLHDFSSGHSNELADELKKELSLDDNTFRERSQETQREILHHYNQFSISTIDAFFQKVIRSFTRESGILGDYRLEVEHDLVLEEVIDNLIDELGSNPDLTDWVVEFAKENLENDKAWDIRQNLREFAEQIFKEEFKAIEDSVLKDSVNHAFFKEFKSKLWQTKNFFIGQVAPPAAEALREIQQRGWQASDFSYGKNSGLLTFFEMMATQRSLKEFKEPSDRIRFHFTHAKNWPGKNTLKSSEIMSVAESKLIPLLREILQAYDRHYAKALSAEVVLRNLHVFGLVADISRKLREYKDQNNLMLLADAPKFLNGVIRDSDTPFIYEKVGSFYRNFLIDEFQDTSGYQWKNFLPLLTNSLDQGYRSFVVGDVKQAIYRWRGGDLTLLQQAIEQQVGKERVEVKELATNFRSAPEIVDFNNALFSAAAGIVSERSGHTLPTEAFADVSQQIFRSTQQGWVQVDFLEEDDWRAAALQKMTEQLETLQLAGIRLSDIAILVRRNDEGQRIAAHLLQYKNSGEAKPSCRYDVISNESLRLDGAASVNLLLGALRYLLNPDDAIARAQLGYEFARLKEPTRELTEVFTVSNQVTFEHNLPKRFAEEKTSLKKLPLYELTESLIDIFQLGDQPGELPYLQTFQDAVLDFYSRERNDLGAFLEWWEENKHKKSIQVSGDIDAAQIVSIHKSKGLQFSYVLIPFCFWNMDHDGWKSPLLWVSSDEAPFNEADFMPAQYSKTLEQTYFKSYYDEERVKVYLDNINVLYVAFTRAERGLYVTAPHPDHKASKQQYSASKLVFDSIQASDRLRVQFSGARWQNGQLLAAESDRTPDAEAIHLIQYPVSRWRDKLVIKKSATGFFDSLEPEQQERIRYGIYIHEVLSRIRYASETELALTGLLGEGLITEEERSTLQKQLQELFSDARIANWFSDAWEIKTETPILLPQGDEYRIDRLLIRDKHAVVIDFKTGEKKKQDTAQVQGYLDTLREMNFHTVEGYLLYLRDREVVEVKTGLRGRVVKKKDENQLEMF